MIRHFGASGWQLPPIGLGGMPLSIAGRPPEAQSVQVIRAFLEGGGRFIDTANVYCLDNDEIGHNERLIRKALADHPDRHEVVVATKGGVTRPDGSWGVDGRPAALRASCEASLRALGTACIDLYQLHAVDPDVPLAESLGELQRLQVEGKVRHIGLSNVSAAHLEAALRLLPVASVQNRCSILQPRDVRNGLVDWCGRHAIAFIPHSPVGGHARQRALADIAAMRTIADELGASPWAVALAWLLAKGDHVLPIPGASRVASVQNSLTASHLRLEARHMELLDGMAR